MKRVGEGEKGIKELKRKVEKLVVEELENFKFYCYDKDGSTNNVFFEFEGNTISDIKKGVEKVMELDPSEMDGIRIYWHHPDSAKTDGGATTEDTMSSSDGPASIEVEEIEEIEKGSLDYDILDTVKSKVSPTAPGVSKEIAGEFDKEIKNRVPKLAGSGYLLNRTTNNDYVLTDKGREVLEDDETYIRPNSNYHYVMLGLYHMDKGTQRGISINSRLSGEEASPALSKLKKEKGVVNRRAVTVEGVRMYEYWLNEKGEEILKDMPAYDGRFDTLEWNREI